MVGRASLPKYVAAAARNKPLAAELLASRGKPPMRMIVAHVIDIRLGQPLVPLPAISLSILPFRTQESDSPRRGRNPQQT